MRRNTEITPQAVIVAVANDLMLLAHAESPKNPDNAEAAKTLFRLSNHWDWATRKAAAEMGVACEPKNERGLPLIGLSEKGQKLRNLYEAIDKGYPATVAPGGYGLSRGVVRKLRNAAQAVPLDDYNALAYLIVTAVLADRLKDLSQYVERLPQGQAVDDDEPMQPRYAAWVAVTGGGENHEYTAWINEQMRQFRQRNRIGEDSRLSEDQQAEFTNDLKILENAAELMKKPWPRTVKGLRSDPRLVDFDTITTGMDCPNPKNAGYDILMMEGLTWMGERRSIRECTLKDVLEALSRVEVGFVEL
jgi:hypothetical protein